MNVITGTVDQFNKAIECFNQAGRGGNTQQQVSDMHRQLLMMHIGIIDGDQQQWDECAAMIVVATNTAIRRGWQLI